MKPFETMRQEKVRHLLNPYHVQSHRLFHSCNAVRIACNCLQSKEIIQAITAGLSGSNSLCISQAIEYYYIHLLYYIETLTLMRAWA